MGIITALLIVAGFCWLVSLIFGLGKRKEQENIDRLAKKLLACPHMFSGLVFSEVKVVEPLLKEEIKNVLKEYFNN